MKAKIAFLVATAAALVASLLWYVYGSAGPMWSAGVGLVSIGVAVIALVLAVIFHAYDHVRARIAGEKKKPGMMDLAAGVVVLAVISLFLKKPVEKVQEQQPVTVSQAEPAVQPADGGCDCDSGRSCTGPKGGHYCITAKGDKRYLK